MLDKDTAAAKEKTAISSALRAMAESALAGCSRFGESRSVGVARLHPTETAGKSCYTLTMNSEAQSVTLGRFHPTETAGKNIHALTMNAAGPSRRAELSRGLRIRPAGSARDALNAGVFFTDSEQCVTQSSKSQSGPGTANAKAAQIQAASASARPGRSCHDSEIVVVGPVRRHLRQQLRVFRTRRLRIGAAY